MNLMDILRAMLHRWYIVVPGLLIAAVGAVGMWSITPPEYERSASQLLIPGEGTLPEGSTNPFLYLGGLTAAADILVRTVGSEGSLRPIAEQYPRAEIEISRDPTAAGPVVLIKVTADRDEDAGAVVSELVDLTQVALEELQVEQAVPPRDRISISPIFIDQVGTERQRNRITFTGIVGAGLVLLTVITASLVDGLVARSRRRAHHQDVASASEAPPASDADDDDDVPSPVPAPTGDPRY